MFVPILLICLASGQCQALPGPIAPTREQCIVTLETGKHEVQDLLKDNAKIQNAQCFEFSLPA